MKYFSFLPLFLLFAACSSDDESTVPPDIGYDYWPVEIGTYVEYRADSVFHDRPNPNIPGIHDTTSYYIREVIESEFEDAAGETSQRLERYKRDSPDEDWVLTDVWFQKRTALNAQKVEENIRFIKLAFPLRAGVTWNGNALNTLEPWTYRIDSVGVSRNYEGLSFPQTATVVQRINKNFVQDEYAFEIFAPGVGLVYRYHRDLDTRFDYTEEPVVENIIRGIEFKWQIIAYGKE